MPDTDLLKEQIEQRKRFMEKINEIHSSGNLNTILLQLKDSIAELFKADRLTIYVIDHKRRMLMSKVKSGSEIQQIAVPIGSNSLAGYCALSGSVLNINDAYDPKELKAISPELSFDVTWDKKTGYRTMQVLCVPMQFSRQMIGVMQLINKKGGSSFDGNDVAYATELATSLSIAIHNIFRLSASTKLIRNKTRYNYLLDKNLIDEAEIQKASTHPDVAAIGMDYLLMRDFKIPREEMIKCLSLNFGTEFVSFDPDLPRLDEVLKKIKPDRLKKECWVPVKIDNSVLQVAMEDPTDLAKQDLIKFIFQDYKRISFVGAFREDIGKFIDHYYHLCASKAQGSSASVSDLLSKLDTSEDPAVEQEVQKVSEQDSVIVQLVNKIIVEASEKNASDIHIEPAPGREDVLVRLRIDGRCGVYQRIPYKYKHAVTSRIKIMAGLDIAERRKPQDGKIDFKKFGPLPIELRVATLPSAGQLEDVVLRILASGEPIPFDNLGLTERNRRVFTENINKPYGLILVVGPTGSGKTTTLHSAVSLINTPETKIWTAEDPIEITQKGLRQVQVNAKIGFTFATALRAFLRADPDVIMVGEMRDEETASIGVESSLTGHLVFSTLHTNSAPETVTRLLDMGLDPFSFSDGLLCILAQRLARRLCSACKESYTPSAAELAEIAMEYGEAEFRALSLDPSGITLAKSKGCPKCNGSGYKGRLGLHELLECGDGMKSLIKGKAEVADLRDQAIADGMTTLKQDGILKCLQGLTDVHEVRRVCIK